jgi:DNA-binding response OmpR family regulator
MTVIHVLVAEDEVLAAMAIEFAMRREGWRVTLAPDGAAALDAALADPPDALVTDLRMPRRDGLWLIRELRSRRPGVPVVVMTGFVGEDAALMAADRSNAVSVVEKPVDPDRLIREVSALCGAG